MNRERSALRTRLAEDTLDYVMHFININGLSSDNFDTEKIVPDWTDFIVNLSHLNGHISSRTETHEETDESVIVL